MVEEKDNNHPAPFLVADHVALDALNSLCAPWGNDIEWWDSGHTLIDWMTLTNLVSKDIAETMKRQFSPSRLDEVAERARGLRERFRGIISQYAGQPLQDEATELLNEFNQLLEKDKQYLQFQLSNDKVSLLWQRDWQQPEQLLAPLIEQMADLLCGDKLTYVRNCEWPPCTLWFLDTTKNKKRRWCSMKTCGNRAKAAAHRARKK